MTPTELTALLDRVAYGLSTLQDAQILWGVCNVYIWGTDYFGHQLPEKERDEYQEMLSAWWKIHA
jgi:hypothetical protein